MPSATAEPPPGTRTRRTTQRDLAQLAGVGQSTVSAVLAGRARQAGISDETAERVLALARDHGYRHDPAARRLKGKQAKVIGAHSSGHVFPLAPRNYNFEYLVGIGLEAEAAGYDLMLLTSASRAARRPSVYSPEGNRLAVADGAVIFGFRDDHDELARLTAEGYPFVRIAERAVPGIDIAWVDADFAGATEKLTVQLHGAGYQRLLYVGEQAASEPRRARQTGYRRAVNQLGLSSSRLVLVDRQQVGDPAWLVEHLRGGVDVFLAEDHLMADNLMQAGHVAGLRINVDYAMAVLQAPFQAPYDGTFCAFLLEPRADIGRHAARLLIELLEGREPDRRQIRLPCEPAVTMTPDLDPDRQTR